MFSRWQADYQVLIDPDLTGRLAIHGGQDLLLIGSHIRSHQVQVGALRIQRQQRIRAGYCRKQCGHDTRQQYGCNYSFHCSLPPLTGSVIG